MGARRRARIPARSGRRGRVAQPTTSPSGATSSRGEGGLRDAHRPRHRPARRPPGDAPLPLRRLRVGRHQAPDAAPRDAWDEVDRLLRGGVLVDLLNVVRQGVRASVESYSLKQIEKFYMPVREGPVTEAGFSVVEYERWVRERDESILDGIAAYNRDDCVSTWMLRTGSRSVAPRRSPPSRTSTGLARRSKSAMRRHRSRLGWKRSSSASTR